MSGKVTLRNRGDSALEIEGVGRVLPGETFEVDERTALLLHRLPASVALVEDVEPEPVVPHAPPRRRLTGLRTALR